jgi:nucleotide-binding universal stress UspA family protein
LDHPVKGTPNELEAIIGIAATNGPSTTDSIEMLHALAIPCVRYHLLHVVSPYLVAGYPNDIVSGNDFMAWQADTEVEKANEFLPKVKQHIQDLGVDPNYISTDVTIGNPRYELVNLSDSRDATLVCVDANIAKPIERFVLGSTAATVIAGVKASVLVSRKRSRTGDLRIVIGVDHSNYCNAALHKFIGWMPRGIAHIDLVTVFNPDDARGTDIGVDSFDTIGAIRERLHDHLAQTERFMKRVTQDIQLHVMEGRPATVLVDAALRFDADLLVVCAKGHGLLERITLGSTSTQVIDSPKISVLVLRNG